MSRQRDFRKWQSITPAGKEKFRPALGIVAATRNGSSEGRHRRVVILTGTGRGADGGVGRDETNTARVFPLSLRFGDVGVRHQAVFRCGPTVFRKPGPLPCVPALATGSCWRAIEHFSLQGRVGFRWDGEAVGRAAPWGERSERAGGSEATQEAVVSFARNVHSGKIQFLVISILGAFFQ